MFLVSICRLGILEPAVELRHLRYFVAVAEMENVSRFGNRLKFLHLTPEPKPISVGIVGTKGRLSPAAEKFWQCAKEAASSAPRPKASGTRR